MQAKHNSERLHGKVVDDCTSQRMNSSVLKFIWAAASLLCLSAAHFVRSETKPNIVIMLMDDVSYSSVVEIQHCQFIWLVMLHILASPNLASFQ